MPEKPRELLRGDTTRCAWCREPRPSDGVVKIKRTKERVYNDQGQLLGTEGEYEELFMHPACFDAYKGKDFQERVGSVLCKFCNDWKMKAKSKLASGMLCICQCHPQLGKQVIRECKILDLKEIAEGLAEREARKKEGLLKPLMPKKDIIDKPTGKKFFHGVDGFNGNE